MNSELIPGVLIMLNSGHDSVVYLRNPDLYIAGRWVVNVKIWLVLDRRGKMVKIISLCGKLSGWIDEYCYDAVEVIA